MGTTPLGLAQFGAGLAGGVLGQGNIQWNQNALINVLNTLNQYGGNAWLSALQNLNPASAGAQGLVNRAPQLLFNGGTSGSGAVGDWQSALQSAMSGMTPGSFQQTANNPQIQQFLQNLQGPAQGMSQVAQSGGWTPQGQDIYSLMQGLAGGQNSGQQNLQNFGQTATQNGGFNPTLSHASDVANYIMNQGGSNSNMDAGMQRALALLGGTSPYISELANAGQGGLSSNLGVSGLTPTGAAGETTALGGLQAGGATNLTDILQKLGANYAGMPAVLGMQQAGNIARNEAGTQNAQAAQGARAQALARGGAPGDVVANGAANQGLADFANQGAQNIANSVGNAYLNQQGLNLQQQGQGANMGLQAGNLQAQRLGEFGNLLNSLEGTATNRYGIAGGQLGNAQQLGTSQAGLGMSGLQGLSGLQSQNVLSALGMLPGISNAAANYGGTGSNALNSYIQSLLGGGQGMQNELGQSMNYGLGAGNLAGNLTGTGAGILNQAGQLGLGQTSAYNQALYNLLGQQGNFTSAGMNMFNTGLGSLGNIGQTFMSPVDTSLSGQSQLFHMGNQQPQF